MIEYIVSISYYLMFTENNLLQNIKSALLAQIRENEAHHYGKKS